MSLRNEMDTFRTDMELVVSDVCRRALKAGEKGPDFQLPAASGGDVRLNDLLAKGPVVLSFDRGGWCEYCNLQLRSLQKVLPQITGLGAALLAITPETPAEGLLTAEKNELAFPVLSDAGSVTAKAFGVASAAKELRPVHAQFGEVLPENNGDDSLLLPVPATYVVDRDGVVALVFVDADYRNRLEPVEILTVLRALSKKIEGNCYD